METQSQLTLTEIIRALGRDTADQEKKTRSVLSRYLDDAETRTLLGASGPVRPTFPSAAVEVFAALLEASERGEVTPKMGAVWLARNFPAMGTGDSIKIGNSGNRETENSGIAPRSAPQTDLAELTATMKEFILTVKDIAPVREDCALTRSQAAALLACAPSSVIRFVRPIRRGAYRRSDVMRYLATGVPQGTCVRESKVQAPSKDTNDALGFDMPKALAESEARDETAHERKRQKRLVRIEEAAQHGTITEDERRLLFKMESVGGALPEAEWLSAEQADQVSALWHRLRMRG